MIRVGNLDPGFQGEMRLYLIDLLFIYVNLCAFAVDFEMYNEKHHSSIELNPVDLLRPYLRRGLLKNSAKRVCDEQRKKIIVNVGFSGLGNRLLGLTSTALLAVLLDRSLFLTWMHTPSCGATFSELFVHYSDASSGVFYHSNDTEFVGGVIGKGDPNEAMLLNHTECRLRLDQTNNFNHFWFLQDPVLFQRLQNECDVIHIQTNQYYAPMLYILEPRLKYLYTTSPFEYFSKCLFRIRYDIAKRAKRDISKLKGKWLSIHSRGYYDSGKASMKALKCANRLLSIGLIDRIFFATDAEDLHALAVKSIPAHALFFYNKTLVPREILGNAKLEGQYIRSQMTDAIREWYVLGQADYCMSTTMESSTFSQTAISNGKCKFIPFALGEDCDKGGILHNMINSPS